MNVMVTFDFNEFNTSTRRNADTRRHGTAEVRRDADGKMYIYGEMGCGKSRDSVGDALLAYLGGRKLLAYRVFN